MTLFLNLRKNALSTLFSWGQSYIQMYLPTTRKWFLAPGTIVVALQSDRTVSPSQKHMMTRALCFVISFLMISVCSSSVAPRAIFADLAIHTPASSASFVKDSIPRWPQFPVKNQNSSIIYKYIHILSFFKNSNQVFIQ